MEFAWWLLIEVCHEASYHHQWQSQGTTTSVNYPLLDDNSLNIANDKLKHPLSIYLKKEVIAT